MAFLNRKVTKSVISTFSLHKLKSINECNGALGKIFFFWFGVITNLYQNHVISLIHKLTSFMKKEKVN